MAIGNNIDARSHDGAGIFAWEERLCFWAEFPGAIRVAVAWGLGGSLGGFLRPGRVRGGGVEGKGLLFLKKKKQKDFYCAVAVLIGKRAPGRACFPSRTMIAAVSLGAEFL